ncbi:MAG: class I SAM-dependent methyltransferase [Spirochaetaceae bacterium]
MEKVVNDKKIWDEIYEKENFTPGWGSPGLDNNIVTYVKAYINEYKLKSLSILDIGCGNGRNSFVKEELEKDGVIVDYTGADFSEKALTYCRETYTDKEFIHLDITDNNLPLKESYDVIIDCGCFHAIPPEVRIKYIDNVKKHCSDSSLLIIGAWYREEKHTEVDKPSYFPYLYLDEWFLNRSDMTQIFNNKFNVISELVDNRIYEGLNKGFAYFRLRLC